MSKTEAGGASAARPARERPLSPHLQIYRWTIPMALSITHRATGAALGVGGLLLAWWLISLSRGPGAYQLVMHVLGAWYGRVVLAGFTWAIVYHLLNGIRHLFWDVGYGYAVPTARGSGWFVLIASVILTAALWAVGLGLVTFGGVHP